MLTQTQYMHALQSLTSWFCLRDMVREKKISMEEGTLMRTLLFMPGGLELHIGVSQEALCVHRCPLVHLHCPCRDDKTCVLCFCATTLSVPGNARSNVIRQLSQQT